MSIVSELKSGFRAQLSSQAVSSIVGGVLTVVLARLLTPNEYGLFFLTISIFSFFKVFTRLGIARSAGRYIAEYKEEKPDQIPHIIRTAAAVNSVTVGIAVIVLIVGHQQIAELVRQPELAPLLLFGVVYLSFTTFATFLSKVWQGFEAITLASIITICSQVGRLVFSVGFVVAGFGAMGALGGYTVATSIPVVIGTVILYRNYYAVGESVSAVESGLRRRIIEYSIPITATNTADRIDKQIDTILIGFFLSPVAVGQYVIGKKVVKFIETPMNAVGFTLSPTFGAQKAEGNITRASRIYEVALSHILLLYIPAGAGMILVADPFVRLFFGSDYSGAVPVLQVLGVFAVLKAVTKLSGNGLDFLGRARSRAIAKTVTSVLNVVLNVALIPTVGIVGAALATVVTYSFYTLFTLYIITQEFELDLRGLLGRMARICVVTAIMSTVVVVFLERIEGWITLFVVVGLAVAVWAVLSVLTGLLDIQRVKSMLV